MTTQTYEWNEMSDTRELLEARTPPFIVWFLGILLVLLAVAIGWSCLYSYDIVVKAQAVVRPNQHISTVSSNAQGTVTEVLFEAGRHVKKGDVLLRIGLDNMPKQEQELATQAKQAEADLNALTTLQGQAKKGIRAAAWEVGSSGAGAKWKVSFEQNEASADEAQGQLDRSRRLLDSINRGRNLFDASEPDYEKYEAYRLKIEQLEAAKSTAAEAYKAEQRTSGGTDDDADNAYAAAQRDLDGYRSQYLVDLNAAIESSGSQLRQLRLERDNLLVQLGEEIESLRQKSRELEGQLADYRLQLADRTIKAPIDGVVNSAQPIAAGDRIEAGARVLTIVPEMSSEYVMQLAVANKDIGEVHAGTPVRYNFQALPAKEYGYLRGTVTWLSPDALTDSESGLSYYSGEAALIGHELKDKHGNAAKIKVGMTAEAQMITGKEKVIDWILKKLSFKQ